MLGKQFLIKYFKLRVSLEEAVYVCIFSSGINTAVEGPSDLVSLGENGQWSVFLQLAYFTSINEQLTNSGTLSLCNPAVGSLISTTSS